MKRKRFTDEQIIGILKEHEAGTPVAELCRKHGVSDASIYKWKVTARLWPPVGDRLTCLRIPMKPAIDSDLKPASHSDFIPAGVPI